MKGLKLFDKLVFFLNTLSALMLLLSYLLPFVPPKSFALISVLSLAVPFLLILNALFLLYWLLKVKRQLILSLFVLLIGYKYIGGLYKFSESKDELSENSFSIMSYNVRLFNVYDWIEKDSVDVKVIDFIEKEDADIICFQEFRPTESSNSENYKYKFEKLSGDRFQHGQVIWSKHPMLDSGSLEFSNSANSAIYSDLLIGNDTIRVYNIHLQSARIDTQRETINRENSGRLFKQAAETFKVQQEQAEKLIKHINASKHNVILSGDFNNTAFSYIYYLLKDERKDAFRAAGNGFGRTYNFPYFPVRIDFILSDPDFSVDQYISYDEVLSDHYPLKAGFSLN